MTEAAKAWDRVLVCLDVIANAKTLAYRYEGKDDAIEAITQYAAIAEPKISPQPDERTCVKCGGTEHAFVYVPSASTISCDHLECPDIEHIHVICCSCQFDRWKHCADHVEAQGDEHES